MVVSARFWAGFVALHLAAVVICKSYYVPDEYWQSLEVAHKMVFGYGELTWEWRKGIRSFLFPAPFAVMYKILQILGIDTPFTLQWLPRLFMVLQVLAQEFLIWKIGGKKAVIIYASLWSTSYIGTRTLSNVTETLLYLLLFYLKSPIFLVVLSFWIRPTSVIASLFFFPWKRNLTVNTFLKGIFWVIIFSLFDMACYKFMDLDLPLCTPLRFLYFNFVKHWAVKFGQQPLLFYFYAGIPQLLLFLTPWLFKFWRGPHFKFILISISVLSLSGHKEVRYLAPIVPFLVLDLARVVPDWAIGVNAVLQMGVFIMIARYHQIGQNEIMKYMAKSPRSTIFLLPCCSTPFTHFVHENVVLRNLDCSPDLDILDETVRFLSDPLDFVNSLDWNYDRAVVYSGCEMVLSDFFADHGMVKTVDIFNSLASLTPLNTSRILLYERLGSSRVRKNPDLNLT
jgi:phosphatidylinositol glycan class B